MDSYSKLLEMYRRFPTSKKIFQYLYKNGSSPPEKILFDLHLTKNLYFTLNKMEKEWKVIKKIPTKGKMKLYDVADEFRTESFTQMHYFEKIREQEGKEGLLLGDKGEVSSRGVFLRAYYNNHSIFGFPHAEEFNDIEFDILDSLTQELDEVFENLKRLKLAYEIRKKQNDGLLPEENFPPICISEKLILHVVLYRFFRAVNEVIEQDSNNWKSHQFINELMKQVCKIGKEIGLEICPKGEFSAYPEKSFTRWLVPSLLFESNKKIAEDLIHGKLKETTSDPIEKKLHSDWFYNKKKIMTLELLEKNAEEARDEYMSQGYGLPCDDFEKNPILWWYKNKTGKKFYDKDLNIDESIAVLSTGSLIESDIYDSNIDLRLDALFGKNGSFIGSAPLDDDWGPSGMKVLEMCDVISSIFPLKDGLSIHKFKTYEKLKEFFSKKEIEFMIAIMKMRGYQWRNHNELERLIWYQAFESNGVWYDKNIYDIGNKEIKSIEQKLKGDFSNFSLRDLQEEMVKKYKKNPLLENKLNEFTEYVEAKLYFEHMKQLLDREDEDFKKILKDAKDIILPL